MADPKIASPASNGGRGLKPNRIGLYTDQVAGIARQQWRARIETDTSLTHWSTNGSIARQQWRARIETMAAAAGSLTTGASPASNGGRGLKPELASIPTPVGGIARQQWRARIETPPGAVGASCTCCIARQQWRARIETRAVVSRRARRPRASPASNGGRGLKLRIGQRVR